MNRQDYFKSILQISNSKIRTSAPKAGRPPRPLAEKLNPWEWTPPPDKSIAHRVLIFQYLQGLPLDETLCVGEDVKATYECLKKMVAEGSQAPLGPQPQREPGTFCPLLNCGSSGTTLRLLTGVLVGKNIPAKLMGNPDLDRRPMQPLIELLNSMGGTVEERWEGLAPGTQPRRVVIVGTHGALRNIFYRAAGPPSAQVKSALLLAAYCGGVEATIEEETPTRDHTERVLEYISPSFVRRGLGKVENTLKNLPHPNPPLTKGRGLPVDISKIPFPLVGEGQGEGPPPSNSLPRGEGGVETLSLPHPLLTKEGGIPGDISSAAFFIVLALLSKDRPLTLRKVGVNPTRMGLVRTLQTMGANIQVKHEEMSGPEPFSDIEIQPSSLKGILVSSNKISSMIDEIPILAVAALFAEGKTVIPNLSPLRTKESDRLAALAKELARTGACVQIQGDSLVIKGCQPQPAHFRTYGDHRLAMAFTILSLLLPKGSTIDNTGCVAKSLPDFYNILKNNLFL